MTSKTEEQSGVALCPFCGGADTFTERADYSSSYVVCNNCLARGPTECQESDDEEEPGKEAAIAAWNTRPAITPRTGEQSGLVERAKRIAKRCADLAKTTPVVGEPDTLWWERKAALGDAADKISELLAALAALAALPSGKDRELVEDAERFRALMRCPRIKMQGSAGVDPQTGELKYPEQPGSVHFGAEFWTHGEPDNQTHPIWGRHALRALADDILAVEARQALGDTNVR